jgi:hypothetical protein
MRVRASDACALILIIGIVVLGIELAFRSVVRGSFLTNFAGTDAPTPPLVTMAGVLALLALLAVRAGGRLTADSVAVVVLLVALVGGMAAQLRVGARLGSAQPSSVIPAQWAVVEQTVPVSAWRAGVNRVVLRLSRATRPPDVGSSADDRRLSAAVDYIRVAEVR